MHFFKRFTFSSGFKKILSNTGFLFGEKVVNLSLSLVVGIYVARYLGPNDFGLLQYAQSLVALFSAIAGMGTTNIVIRDLVEQPAEREGEILGTTFMLMFLGGITTTIIVIVIGYFLNDETIIHWLIIITSSSLVLQVFHVFDYWFQSKILSKYSVYARVCSQVVVSILKVAFILLSISVIYFSFTIVISGIISGIIWAFSYNKIGEKTFYEWSFDKHYAQSLLKDAWPLILSGLSVAIYMKIDQVMLLGMVDNNAVGNYAVAVKISELWYFIPVSIISSAFPSIIKSKKKSIEKYYQRLQYLYDLMAGSAITIAIPMALLSDYIIYILFGSEYKTASDVLTVHIWAGIFVFLGVARSRWIINENYQWYGMISTLIGAVTNVILNLCLIPLTGILGAAWATVISQATAAWIIGYFISEIRISSKMIFKAILSALLIYPCYKSIKKIIREGYE